MRIVCTFADVFDWAHACLLLVLSGCLSESVVAADVIIPSHQVGYIQEYSLRSVSNQTGNPVGY